MKKFIFIIAAASLVGGCAITPKPLQGEFAGVSPEQAVEYDRFGDRVRWGGPIIQTRPGPGQTCFEILSKDLNVGARPLDKDASQGRFIACKSGFHEPEVFSQGRELTVVGRLTGTTTEKIGEYDYRFPTVDVETLYLWPERDQYDRVYYPVYRPYFWNFGLHYGYGHFGHRYGPHRSRSRVGVSIGIGG